MDELESPKKLGSKDQRKKMTVDDFEMISRLGQGAYGEVDLVRRKDVDKKFALKQIEKKLLSKQKKEYQAMVEREILCRLDHPGIIKLNASFTDPKRLYFVLEYCEGGLFKDFLKLHFGRLSVEMVSFYVGEIVNVLEYLHLNGVVHRDLKPQNIMLSKAGHIKLIDFGTAEISRCKVISQEFRDQIESQKKAKKTYDEEQTTLGSEKEGLRRSSFVGTSYYISPELIEHNICEPPSDLWALGCIIYQLYYGRTPFFDKQEFLVFERIKNVEYEMPPNKEMPEEAADLIRRLLVKDPNERLGAGMKPGFTYADLKQHKFFRGLNVDTLFSQSPPETQQFEQQKTKEKVELQRVRQTYDRRVTEQIQSKSDNEVLIYGLLEKKKFIVYSPIYVMIQRDLTIFMFKPQTPDKKKRVQLDPGNAEPAELLATDKFSLATVDKKYTFRVEEASKWVDQINGQLHKRQHDKK